MTTASETEWRPGSFTKNFSWGPRRQGLRQLHETIRVGFNNEVKDVPRSLFRRRVARLNRPDYIPINFFLFNKLENGDNYLVADELVFQAINFDHSSRFDRLSLYTFNLSLAGIWRGASPYQRRPAQWARHYITDRVARDLSWDTSKISANDIERFVSNAPRYKAEGARKLATNLNYLYQIGRLEDFRTERIESWWLDALFLTLDRTIEDRLLDGVEIDDRRFSEYLRRSGFHELSGPQSLEKGLASRHLVALYRACGARGRFSDEQVRERVAILLPELQWYSANNPQPIAALHPSNPRIIKAIPRACAMLAKYVGFETLELDELENFDVSEFVRRYTKQALERLKERNIVPTMSAEELLKLTRGK